MPQLPKNRKKVQRQLKRSLTKKSLQDLLARILKPTRESRESQEHRERIKRMAEKKEKKEIKEEISAKNIIKTLKILMD